MARTTKTKRVRVGVRLPEQLVIRATDYAASQRRTFTSVTEEALEAAVPKSRRARN